MATSKKLGLTRDQLASFLDDFEKIKQFERLFSAVDTIVEETDGDALTVPDSATSKAEQAQGSVAALEQDALTALASVEARVSSALSAVDQLRRDIEGLQSAPTQQDISALRRDIEGLQCLPPPREARRSRFGSFYDTTTQSAAVINTAYAMTFNTTDLSRGVYIGSPTSRVYVDEPSVYNVQFSAQVDNTSGTNHLANIWLRVNGVDVANSAGQVRLKGNDGELVATWNYLADLKANDYIELMWSVSDTAVQLTASAAAAPVPAIPSVILTVTNNIEG